jgi:hypothetical protein
MDATQKYYGTLLDECSIKLIAEDGQTLIII